MDIRQKLTPVNFQKGSNKQNRALVIHSAWGYYQGSISWAHNPDAKASFHYIISAKGEITQVVKDEDIAWHAGVYDEPIADFLRPNPNLFTIGVEFEDKRDKNWAYPEAQRKAGIWLVDYLCNKWKIPKHGQFVLLHKNLNPTRRSDPVGKFSLDWLLGGSMTDTMTIDVSLFERIRDASEKFDKVVEYLEIDTNDPTLTPYEDVQRVIAGYKSRVNDLTKQLGESQGEVENREEQVGRLKGQLLNEQKAHSAEVIKLNKDVKNEQELRRVAEGRVTALQAQVDTISKQKGDLNKKLKKCEASQSGQTKTSFWDFILKLLRRG